MVVEEVQYNGKTYMTIEALAFRTGYDQEYLRKLATADRVDAIQVGATRLIDPLDLERYQGERKSRGARPEWRHRNEAVKMAMMDVMLRHGKDYAIHWFEGGRADGFTMYVTCNKAQYEVLANELEAIGLKPKLVEGLEGPGVWEYEVFIDVPDAWEPPKSASES